MMPSKLRWTMLRRTLPVYLLVVLICRSVSAQPDDEIRKDIDTPGLLVEAIAGWDGVVDQSTPVPVSFLITNKGEALIEGKLSLFDPIMGHDVPLDEVYVAPGTARRVSSIRDMRNWYECFATLKKGTQVLWRRQVPIATGNEFLTNVNYALFVDDGGRKLQLPGALTDTSVVGVGVRPTELTVAAESGRPVQCLTLKSWQIPNHAAPLMSAQAIVFREDADADTLSRVQWQAIARWMCRGGTVFVHHESEELIDRLMKESPLESGQPVSSGEFTVRHAGMGSVFEYRNPLFDQESEGTREQIAITTAQLPKQQLSPMMESAYLYNNRGGRADRNRILVVGFFLLYAFLSGVVSVFLFRLTQRRIVSYTVVVVASACVLAGLLRGVLRISQGDLRWMTVTQVGEGGAIQVARIEVQSAGGRNTTVGVKGEHADLQFIGRTRYYRYWNQHTNMNVAFNWQRNLSTEDNSYRINVPMTPWGGRRLHAAAFQRDVKPLEFKLKFEPYPAPAGAPTTPLPVGDAQTTEPEPADPPGVVPLAVSPTGVFTLEIVNHLPTDLTNCWIVIAATHRSLVPQPAAALPIPGANSRAGRMVPPQPTAQPALAPPPAFVDVYQMHHIPVIPGGGTHEETIASSLQEMPNNWDLSRSWEHGTLTVPRLSRLGTASAWLIGELKESPFLQVDESQSDFVPEQQLHLFMQQIKPADMTDAAVLLGAPPANANQPVGDDQPVESTQP